MRVSRREFVSTASGAAAASLCAIPSSAFWPGNSNDKSARRATLLDLESNCVLSESLAGMRAALASSQSCIATSEFLSSDPANMVIVAAAGTASRETFRAISELLGRGATVLWESGAAFLNSVEFAQQQALTMQHFGISMAPPVHVWPQSNSRKGESGALMQDARRMRAIGHEQIPYVEYRWPVRAHMRDFSRVLPVSAANGRAIAFWGAAPVAWSKSVAAGTLIFLGSPLGPALRAGDEEAAELFRSIVAR